MASPVVWFEVAGRDLAALTSFYSELFGWKISVGPGPVQYGLVDTGADGGGIPGGVFAPGDDVEYVSFYVAVDDLDASLERAEELGAKVLQPPTQVPDGPTIAMMADPEGHRIGLIKQ